MPQQNLDETARTALTVLRSLEHIEEAEQPILLFGVGLELLEHTPRTPELEHELERVILVLQSRLGIWKAEDELEERHAKKRRKHVEG
jgi:hypothetical protein